ncbi:MAG: protein kinase [Pseudomonadota bacterium]
MSDPLQNQKCFDRYELLRPLGRGGMGVVYLARDSELDRLVAIKCVDKKAGEVKLAKRLRTEARLMAQLNHQNIVHLHDVIENEDVLGLVIEYVEGAGLKQKCDEVMPNRSMSLRWLIQIAQGLEKAHAAGITHCDLKPDNVLVTNDGTIKIVDFGIAKARMGELLRDDGLTQMDQVSGSYSSLSPEQATGAKVDYRTDLFSFGILIHTVLYGRHPFGESSNHLAMVQRIVNNPYKLRPEFQGRYSPNLEKLLDAILQKEPAQRPESAAVVARCLENELKRESGETIAPDDLTVELSAIQPKTKLLTGRNIVLAGVAVVALTFAAWQYWPEAPGQTLYIAVTKPEISALDDVDEQQLRRIGTTMEQSTQETVLLTTNLSLIPDLKLEDYNGDLQLAASANAADVLLQSSAECSVSQCELKLQRLESKNGENWEVVGQRSWPVLTDSLADVRSAMLNELPRLFPEAGFADSKAGSSLAEEDYRAYLEIYQRSNAATGSDQADLDELELLQRQSPGFVSIYSLYTLIAKHLYATRGEETFLDRLELFLASAPPDVKATVALKNLEFELLLQRGDNEAATNLLSQIETMTSDRVQLNDLRGNLAYAQSDYQTTLRVDTENALLRPSTSRYYKLAVSQYLVGDLASAKSSLDNALRLTPNHLYSMDLSGAIAFSEGDVERAVGIYSQLVAVNATSANLSNYGLALALNGEFQAAVEVHKRAIDLNPDNAGLILNLADSHDLSGDEANAAVNYQRILELTENPSSAQNFSIRVQALSHLGMHNDAIKTLRQAQDRFPSQAELTYAAAIVHVLAGNHQAAIVEVESAIKTGTSPIWFQFKWFEDLCVLEPFRDLSKLDEPSICSANSLSEL